MKREITYLLLILALCLTSCDGTGKKFEVKEGGGISWAIHGPKHNTKSLIDSEDDLIRSCTPEDVRVDPVNFGEGKSIGFWADYVNPDGTVVPDVFGSTLTQLMHFDQGDGRGKAWNYQGAELLWAIGGRYLVRSFYPQTMSEAVVTSSTDAELFVLEYNTHKFQEDLMVAYNSVYTIDPVEGSGASIFRSSENTHSTITHSADHTKEGYSQAFNLSDPIPMFFRHTMAAVRIRVTFDHDNSDELMSVVFYNDNNDGFHNVGLLVYGDANSSGATSGEGHVAEDPDAFSWVTYQSSFGSEPFYEWSVRGDNGVEFSRTTSGGVVTENMAVPYYDCKHWTRRVNGIEEADIDGDPLSLESGEVYSNNEGWVLIIPQEQPGGVKMRLETKNMGVREVLIPKITGTDIDGTPNPAGEYLVAAHKYTYTIVFRKTNLDVLLSIAPWNELKANVEIQL